MNTVVKTSGFAMQPSSMNEAMELAAMLSSSQMVPKGYQNRKEDTLVAMMMGSELGLNPIQALQNIAVINGRPSIYGDALLALVQNHPAFVSINESYDANTFTATCTVKRKGGEPHTQTFSKTNAEKAKLWGKQGPWTQYPDRMLAMRARGFALRNQFADALAGLITAEEAEDLPTEELRTVNATTAIEAVKEPSYYPTEDFEKNFPRWEEFILAEKKTSADIISMIESKGLLTNEQKDQINKVGK
jgi:hypothetical protein